MLITALNDAALFREDMMIGEILSNLTQKKFLRLMIDLWRFVETGRVPEGATVKA